MGLQSSFLREVKMVYALNTGESIPANYDFCDGRVLTTGTHDLGAGAFTMPDLRNVFILGADMTKAIGNAGGTNNASSDAPGPRGTGGIHSKALAIGELPSHTHTGTTQTTGAHIHSGSTAASNGDHGHTASTNSTGSHAHAGSTAANAGAHTHSLNDPGHSHVFSPTGGQLEVNDALGAPGGYGGGHHPGGAFSLNNATTGISVASNGDHNHVLSIAADGSHSHTVTVNNAGAHTHTLTVVSDGDHAHTFTTNTTGSGTAYDTRPRYFGLVFIMRTRI